jgi:RimJ/RimL family protein N-acetyltransferase
MYLRRLCLDDAAALFELDSDPQVMRYISKGEPTPFLKLQDEILPRILGYYVHNPPQGFWGAHLIDNDEFIGWFHLRPDKITPHEMELGYRLKRHVWGKGLATEGSRALVDNAFREWNYDKLSARTLLTNLASQRVMEKAGLVREGEFTWSAEVLPGWTEEERLGVKYGLSAADYWKANSPDAPQPEIPTLNQ